MRHKTGKFTVSDKNTCTLLKEKPKTKTDRGCEAITLMNRYIINLWSYLIKGLRNVAVLLIILCMKKYILLYTLVVSNSFSIGHLHLV